MQQGSSDWHGARSGRFTGSQMHRLMGIKGLGLTGESYAFENAIEIAFGRNEDEQFVSFDMQRGLELEPFAFNKFAELKEIDFISVEKCTFFPYESDAGASPDGIVGTEAVLEIKCPKPPKFFNLVRGGISEIDKEYIIQMQTEMLCTNSKQAHFFNYIIYNGMPMWHEIIVPRDEVMIELIKDRIKQAAVIRDQFVKDLLEKKQF
jgi:hypothetical protein